MYTYTSNYHYLFSYFNLQISLILKGSILAFIYVPVCFFMNVNFSFGHFSIKEFILKKTHTQKKTNAITLKRLKKLNVAQISIIKNYPLGKNWLHSVYELGVILYNKFPTKPKST